MFKYILALALLLPMTADAGRWSTCPGDETVDQSDASIYKVSSRIVWTPRAASGGWTSCSTPT